MKDLLFLDDFRTPKLVPQYDFATATQAPFYKEDLWDVVVNYEEFVEYVSEYYKTKNKLPELISFDHDLHPSHYEALTQEAIEKMDTKEKTGHECAKWLVDFCLDNELMLPKYLVHSQNPAGRENIKGLLDNFKDFQEKNK